MNDRRTAHRYDLALPVMVRVSPEHESASRMGKTRDISTRGVYMVLEKDINAGAELHLTVILAMEVSRGSEGVVRAIGKVVRVEKLSGNGSRSVGLAAVIVRYEIVRNESFVS
jgi:c-di-GMP-binding flagellar brake protein YcgR